MRTFLARVVLLVAVALTALPSMAGAQIPTYGTSRTDVGGIFGSQFTNAGYTATLTGLPPGSYTITAFGRTTATGTFNLLSRTITVQ